MRQSVIALTFLTSVLSLSVSAQDIKAGEAVWKKYNCASCHGDDAKTPVMNTYPVLAGQHSKYLAQTLYAYQRGQAGAPATSNIRKNAVMGALASALSAEEIESVAAWLATLDSPLSVKR
ncbi:c-type cytochrome [Paenalcaligenes niemegkensis]|uniref:c-type cytochrome n=1 Tax=Paenalcaligenes niemegkensis TaxID=2895469 RepID=UPI001EE8E814|nr:c-type cytochrome [Paenalcaligenes niemegkensis]MCQ9616978.1 c-type cytochrome [Paenalcaligenes niemegkensis]